MQNLDTGQSFHSSGGGNRMRDGDRLGAQSQKVKPQVGHPPREHVSKNLRGLLRDGAKLVDLQLQLLSVDLRDFWAKAKLGLIGVIVACVGLLSTFPILLMGLSYLLESQLGWTRYASFLTVAAIALVIGVGVLTWGALRLNYSVSKLSRSSDELSNNLTWLRNLFDDDET